MKRFLLAVITQKWVEAFSALAMVVAGVLLTTLPSSIWLKAAGSVLSIMGGILISWSASLVYTKDQAREEIKTQLEALRRQLGTVCGLISQSLTEAESGTLDDRSFIALIWQNVQSLYSIVNEIQVMTGGRFEAEAVLETVKSLEDFAQRIAKVAAERPGEQRYGEELTQLSQQLSTYAQSLKQQNLKTTVTVPCPGCGGDVSIVIGIISGDSAVATCSTCGTRFHAHRRADGTVFTRKWGFYSLVRSVAITCPTCNGKLFIRTTQEQVGLMIRYCLNCFTKIQIDVGKGEIVSHQTGTPKEGSIVGEEAGHSVLECPACKGRIKAFKRIANDCYAVCYKCDILVKAQYAGNMISGGVIQ